jgi:hypothetical protein
MFNGPLMLVVVLGIARRLVSGLEASAQESERAKVALAHDWNARIEKHGGGDADTLLVPPRLNQAGAVRYHLATTCRTHVRQDREIDSGVPCERDHCVRPVDHLGSQVVPVFVQNLRSPGDHVNAVATMDIRHRAWRT